MIGAEFLAHCKPGVRIVNVARGEAAAPSRVRHGAPAPSHPPTLNPHPGGLLEYEAVHAALESGHIGGLGLDVHPFEPFDPAHPIAQHPK